MNREEFVERMLRAQAKRKEKKKKLEMQAEADMRAICKARDKRIRGR